MKLTHYNITSGVKVKKTRTKMLREANEGVYSSKEARLFKAVFYIREDKPVDSEGDIIEHWKRESVFEMVYRPLSNLNMFK